MTPDELDPPARDAILDQLEEIVAHLDALRFHAIIMSIAAGIFVAGLLITVLAVAGGLAGLAD